MTAKASLVVNGRLRTTGLALKFIVVFAVVVTAKVGGESVEQGLLGRRRGARCLGGKSASLQRLPAAWAVAWFAPNVQIS